MAKSRETSPVSQPWKEHDIRGPTWQTKYRKLSLGRSVAAEVSAKGNAAECTDAAHALCKQRETDEHEMSVGFLTTIPYIKKPMEAVF